MGVLFEKSLPHSFRCPDRTSSDRRCRRKRPFGCERRSESWHTRSRVWLAKQRRRLFRAMHESALFLPAQRARCIYYRRIGVSRIAFSERVSGRLFLRRLCPELDTISHV